MKKKRNIIYILFAFLTCLFIIGNSLNNSIYINNKILKTNNFITLKKIVIVGDSRMELMSEKDKELNIPKAIVFDAKSGASINWFKEIGIHKLINILKNKNYEYHVIFNLGVNDLSEKIDIDKRVNEYYKLYKRIYISNEGVYFYFLSVNPVDDSIIKNENRSNKNIRLFNTKMKSKLDNLNIKYCDSYNNLKFDLPDGLHYDTNTDKKILYYIINDCVSLF